MLKAVWFLLKLGAFTAVVLFLATRPGAVEIDWHGWHIETSAGFVVACLLVLLAVWSVFYRLWRAFASTPHAWRRYKVAQSREQGYRDVTQGFVAIASGDPVAAGKHAARAEAMIPGAPLSKLLSAQTHLLKGEGVKARKLFAELLEHESAAMLGLRGLLQETLRSGDHREALEHIRSAHDLQPKRGWVIKTLFDLETRHREWERAGDALKKAEKLGIFPKETATRHRQALLLARADDAFTARESVRAHKLASQAFDINPAFVPAATRLVKFYDDVDKKKSAVQAIRKSWALNPHPALAEWWMRLAPPLKKNQSPHEAGRSAYLWAKELSDLNPQHNASARLLGLAALESRQWSQARELLTKVSDYKALARLERAERGDEAKAREWLEVLSENPAEAAWVCASCGHVAEDWNALCRHCHAFDTMEWMVPAHAPAQVPPAMLVEHAPQGLFISATPLTGQTGT